MTKSRANLKEFFKKGAIPTEANFAELIDSMLNQNDDSISKLPGGALSITAVGADESLLDFNRLEASGPKLSWQIKQNAANKLGFSIQDATTSRLFIDSNTGNVGIGTNEPANKLQVTGGSISTNKNLHTQRGRLAFSGTADDPNHTIYNNNNNIDQEGAWDGMKMNVYEGLEVRVDQAHSEKPKSALRIIKNGNVGIGTNTPATKLEVKGGSISTDGNFYTTRGRLSFSGSSDNNNHSIYNNYNDIDKEGSWDGIKMNVFEGLEVRVDQAHSEKPKSALRIIKNGNVGIGTNIPNAKLEVNGNAIVAGYVAAQKVYFSAYVATNGLGGPRDTLILGAVSQNIGNGFDITTGTFKAPIAGVYLFTYGGFRSPEVGTAAGEMHWQLLLNGKNANTGGVDQGEPTERTLVTWQTPLQTAFRTIILSLVIGDKVTIKQIATSTAQCCDNYRSGLEGVLISATL